MYIRAFRSAFFRLLLGLASLVLVVAAWWGLAHQNEGLINRYDERDGVPTRFMAPSGAQDIPAVILAHGFGVSQQIMLGYGYAIARAGYGVMLLDFAGHGRNPNVLGDEGQSLQGSLDTAYQELISQPEVDPAQIALLGQSMGSGAVMQAGIEHPQRYVAVIAVSPTDAEVNENSPPNLMLQAGNLEKPFAANARDLLDRAGGPNQEFRAGVAREFVEIPNVEHITILFSPTSQHLAVDWLDQSFGRESAGKQSDRRMIWYALHLIGWMGLGSILAPTMPKGEGTEDQARPGWWPVIGLLLAPVAATIILATIAAVVEIDDLLGILVSGALAIWILVLGGIWLFVGFRPSLPGRAALLSGIALFGLLWLAAGLVAHFTWHNWFLIPARLARWPVLALACLPWKLAAGYAGNRQGLLRWAGWWIAQSILITGGLVATAFLLPGMFILILMAPAVPVVLLVEGIAGAAADDPWAYGLGTSLFFGWLVASLFPLV